MTVSSICRIILLFLVGLLLMSTCKTYSESPSDGGLLLVVIVALIAFATMTRAAHADKVEQQLKQLIEKDKETDFDETDYTDKWEI